VRLLKEPTRRIRFLTQDQAAVLLKELPQHLRDMAAFALATGLRAANITGLCWDQVDMERKQAWVHPDQAKARRAIAVPLNDAALEVLEHQKGNHFVKVFTYEGEPVKQVSTKAWYKALKRAGIENFRFHDLRHTFASRLVMSGVDLYRVQTLMGHKMPAMTLRYAHLSPQHLRAAVELLEQPGVKPWGSGA
jgi:integrase